MKTKFTYLATTASVVVGSLLTVAPVTLRAEPATTAASTRAAKRAQICAMVREDPELSRAAFGEMMKSREKKRYTAKVMARDPEFHEFYVAEIGSGAPHQERNPSAHPELFQTKPSR